MSEIIQFINGVPQTDKKLHGYFEVQKKRERNGRFLSKYWKLMGFFSFNCPDWLNIHTKDDADSYIKSQLGTKVYRPDGTFSHVKDVSISFANMQEHEFETYYSMTLDICCRELGASKDIVIEQLVGFF